MTLVINDLSENICWHWRRIFDFSSKQEKDAPIGRFFHAACKVTGHSLGDISRDESERVAVLVHGGIASLDELVSDAGFVVFYPAEALWSYGEMSSRGHTEKDDGGETAVEAAKNADVVSDLHRFGHTLTDLGFKTLLLAGGALFGEKAPGEDFAVVHYHSNAAGYIEVFRDVSTRKEKLCVPCGSCRVHHQAVLSSGGARRPDRQTTLSLIGGGAICLGFGSHFCTSINLNISFKLQGHPKPPRAISSRADQTKCANSSSSWNSVEKIRSALDCQSLEKTVKVLLVGKSHVKPLKTYLESRNFLERSVRICPCVDRPEGLLVVSLGGGGNRTPDALPDYKNLMAVPIARELELIITADVSPDTR